MNSETTIYLKSIEEGNLEIANLILEKYKDKIDLVTHSSKALIAVCDSGNIEVIKSFIEKGIDPASNDNYLIKHLPKKGDFPDFIKSILPRVDIAAGCNACFKNACTFGRIETVKLLLTIPEVNPADEDNDAINYAADKNQVEVVKLLLADSRIDPTNNYCRPIRFAGNKKHKEMVRLLLSDSRITMQQIEIGCQQHSTASALKFIREVKTQMDDEMDPKLAVIIQLRSMVQEFEKLLIKVDKIK